MSALLLKCHTQLLLALFNWILRLNKETLLSYACKSLENYFEI